MTAADRTRAWRARERDSRLIAPVEIDQSDTQYLHDAELLRADQLEDRAAIGAAIRRLFDLVKQRWPAR
jgi:hypothetical protein